MNKKAKSIVMFSTAIVFLSAVVLLLLSLSGTALSCYSFTASEGCTGGGCYWRSDDWGSSCVEPGCWNYNTQTTCPGNIAGTTKNCTWQSSSGWGWCEKASCYSFSGGSNNNETCEGNSFGLKCDWYDECQGWNPTVSCWEQANATACNNYTGCKWGDCREKGCWSYWTSEECTAATDSRGQSCAWKGYCYEQNCWNFEGTNQTYCEGGHGVAGLSCKWVNDAYTFKGCQDFYCGSLDYTNASTCINNSYNLSCKWDGTRYCMPDESCAKHTSSANCDAANATGCTWKTSAGSGWCEEINCWTWDSWRGGSSDACTNNATNYGLSCEWQSGSGTEGWCYPTLNVTCSNITTERECMDTFYCWWKFTDWNNPALGGTCSNPGSETVIFEATNPGCYIFDMNTTNCNATIGCNYTLDNQCSVVSGHANADHINANGINCSMINSSTLCTSITMLSSCCEWKGANCTGNRMTTRCWDDMEPVPEGIKSCEDVSMVSDAQSAKALCERISGDPWYMPCKWNNNSITCEFKSTDIFGNRTQSLALVDNQKSCDAAGGKWIVDNYCEGNQSIPAGRCEQKGKDERNCDKACFACELDFNGMRHNSTQTARKYCYDSLLGFCEFVTDTSAPNSQGFCRAKDAFKKGIASNCKTDCASCTYMGNPNASSASDGNSFDSCNSPKCYCERAKDFNSVKCKWIVDNSSSVKGYCMDSNVQTCNDACDRCYTQSDCATKGRSGVNATGSCSWSTSQEKCTKTGETMEVCWDGISNNNNSLIDCMDPQCYADSFCGFVSGCGGSGSGDCFGWPTQTECEDNSCTWMTDPWSPGGWCDFPGVDCWKHDGSESACMAKNTTCDWTSGSGSGGCEQNWSMGEDCYSKMDNATCADTSGCSWTADSWCLQGGNSTDWCTTQGGWCDPSDFQPKNCWQHDTNSTACDGAAGCRWETKTGGSNCEVDWSSNLCMTYSSDTTCNAEGTGCIWRASGGPSGGYCDNQFMACWDYYSSATCDTTYCRWDSWMNSCQPKCFNPDLNADTCNAVTGCRWSSGWCMDDWSTGDAIPCWNSSLSDSQTNCDNEPKCKWKNPGWCNPKGFAGGDAFAGGGGGSQTGMECWKYDGNQTLCTSSSTINITCSWMPELRPFCEPDWSAECWQYDYDYANCTAQSTCYWKNFTESADGDCVNMFDLCWENATLSSNQEACDANDYCNWTTGFGMMGNFSGGGWCEPNCFKAADEASCSGSCRWMSGFCNAPGMNCMFAGMETGPPVMIAMDPCCSNCESSALDNNTYADMCGIGLKDMGAAFGFATGVRDFSQAGICNGEKLGWAGSNFGSGNKDVKYYVYLDTDGSTSSGCRTPDYSSSAEEGYEFMLTYLTEWDSTSNKAKETLNVKRCLNYEWTTADITLNTMKQKMCGEIQGMMVAVNKIDLEKFPALYDSSKDIRVYAAMTNGSAMYNETSPLDTAGPGWVTPGAVDFKVQGFFEKGADAAKFEDILMQCYVKYEDCYNLVDDDNDNLIDCNDWDCQLASHCAGAGVNLQTDTSMPRISGVNIEEYPDSALIMYSTNKPTNGTLTFWYNDSTCSLSAYNRTISDVGIRLGTVREHKMWHAAEIFNDSGVISLDYNLTTNTPYYYKLKICDYNNKCSVSACTNFTTAESVSKCSSYCNFVTKVKVPTGWAISYDLNRDGTYEHIQGQMCGPNAGMKTNYTDGRKANIKLLASDSSGIYFYNATLTRTGLSVQTRNISSSSSLISNSTLTDSSGNTIGMVGMIAETRDKIINNLHPEVCHIAIPRGDTDCTHLWHCDDSGANCRDKTSVTGVASVSITSTLCTWQLPYCEFSTWAGAQPGTYTPPTTTTSGGGGGGGAAGGAVEEPASEAHTIAKVEANKELAIDVLKEEEIGINEVRFTALEEILDVKITISKLAEMPSSVTAPAESVYRYLEFDAPKLEGKVKEARIKFEVGKAWLAENNANAAEVALQRYQDNNWRELTTRKLREDNAKAYYEAISPGFSVFAVTVKKAAPAEEVAEEAPEAAAEAEEEAEKPVQPQKPVWLKPLLVAIGLLAIALIVLVVERKKKAAAEPKKRGR